MGRSSLASVRQRCLERAEDGENLLFADGYDEAILGIGVRNGEEIVVYDAAKIARILSRRDGMTTDEVEEFMEYNIIGAWMGDRTPLYLRRF
jgi:hypothetical protein